MEKIHNVDFKGHEFENFEIAAGKHYGEGIIKEYSIKLTKELNRSYSLTSLKYMRNFYFFSKRHSLSDQLTYIHYKYKIKLLV